jgi:hypothetical protein
MTNDQLELFYEFPTLDEFVEQIGARDRAALEEGEEDDQGPAQG